MLSPMSNVTGTDTLTVQAEESVIPVFNPSTEERIGEVVDADAAAVDRAVGAPERASKRASGGSCRRPFERK